MTGKHIFRLQSLVRAWLCLACLGPAAVHRPETFVIYAIGDSITVGYYATDQLTQGYVPLLAERRGWDFTNVAVGGATAISLAPKIYALEVTGATVSTYFLGTNDELSLTSPEQHADWAAIQLAQLAYLAIPNSQKIMGADTSAVSYNGEWADTPNGRGRHTTQPGAAASFTVTGSAVVLAFTGATAGSGETGRFTLSVDGQPRGAYGGSLGDRLLNMNYAPAGIVIDGLTDGTHTITITKASTDGVVWFDWAAGVSSRGDVAWPPVLVANLHGLTARGYRENGGSPANIAAFNGMIAANVERLRGLGLHVALVDVHGALNLTTDLYADGIHPSDRGHAKLAGLFDQAMSAFVW